MENFNKLKKRIKKNEGFKNIAYLDQLGNPTIGYGHLIKKSEDFLSKKKFSKKYLSNIFEKDFFLALSDFKKNYQGLGFSKNINEVLIEMIFQLGIKKTTKFKKFNFFLKQNFLYLAALEMIDSRWFLQTPKRVDGLVAILLGFKNVR